LIVRSRHDTRGNLTFTFVRMIYWIGNRMINLIDEYEDELIWKKISDLFIITSGHWPLSMHAFALTWFVWNFSIAYSFFFSSSLSCVQINIKKCLSVVYVHEIGDFFSLLHALKRCSTITKNFFVLDSCWVPSLAERARALEWRQIAPVCVCAYVQEKTKSEVSFNYDSLIKIQFNSSRFCSSGLFEKSSKSSKKSTTKKTN